MSELYATLLDKENKQGITPRESASLLLEAVGAQGFADYGAFQSLALAKEYAARAEHLGRDIDLLQRHFLDMSRPIGRVQTETADLTEAFMAIRTVPMNMRIIVSGLENAGGPISPISVNYSLMLEEMTTWVKTIFDSDDCVFARIRDAILTGQFLSFSAAVEHEMIEVFGDKTAAFPDGIDSAAETAEVARHRQKFVEDTVASLVSVVAEAKRFVRSVLDMKRYVTGLSSTRMMCKIESAALSNSGTALAGIAEKLDQSQTEILQRLARLVELNAFIQGNAAMLRSIV